MYALVFTLLDRGNSIRIEEPHDTDRRDYLRRTNFWALLKLQGLEIPEQMRGHDIGRAEGLVEPSLLRTDASTQENVTSSDLLFDRLRRSLDRAGLTSRHRVASIFSELAGNAAEHSRSARGAFVMAQAYPESHEIEIAVADVGRGIRTSLGHDRFATDAEALSAAMEETVTGRRDGAGNLVDGGYGLTTVAIEADFMAIRSGNAALVSEAARNARNELVLIPQQVTPLDGTLVVATVSMKE